MKQFQDENGINFHKLIKGLSNNALRYLINIAKQESFNRSKNVIQPEFENKALPKLHFTSHSLLTIKEEVWKVVSYKYAIYENNEYKKYTAAVVHNAYVPVYEIDVELYKWEELAKQNMPITVTLLNVNNHTTYDVQLHSRSKIFWFHKILENAKVEEFERKFSFD